MLEPIDEYSISHLREYQGYQLTSIVKEGLDLCESEDEKKQREQTDAKFEKLCKCIKGILQKYVEKVYVSGRLVTSPCCIVANQHAMSGNMERISRAQTLRGQTKDIFGNKKQFEINPHNAIIVRMRDLIELDANDKSVRDLTWILFETALLQSGFSLESPSVHTERIYRMMMLGLGLDLNMDADLDLPVEEEKEAEPEAKLIEGDQIADICGDLLDVD